MVSSGCPSVWHRRFLDAISGSLFCELAAASASGPEFLFHEERGSVLLAGGEIDPLMARCLPGKTTGHHISVPAVARPGNG